jgi:hypothetical protein
VTHPAFPAAGQVVRVQWRYDHWTSRSGNSRVYLRRAAAMRLAERLDSLGAVVTVSEAPIGEFTAVEMAVNP